MGQLDLFKVAVSTPVAVPAPSVQPPLPPEAYLTAGDLRERGWTPTVIKKFLGPPDAVEEYRRGGWLIREHRFTTPRVLAAEASSDFTAWSLERDARRAAAARGVERAMAEALAWSPVVPKMEMGALRRAAVDSYNAWLMRRLERDPDRELRPATLDADRGFLDRICVNYLRHRATNYDALLAKLDHLGRRGEAVAAVRRRVLHAISDAYPELAEECARQLQNRSPR